MIHQAVPPDLNELGPTEGESRQQLAEKSALLDGIPYGLFVLDAAGRVTLLNRGAAQFFRLVSATGTADLVGMDLWEKCPEVADSTLAKACRDARAEQRSFQIEAYVPRLRRWYAFEGTPTPGGLCVILRDVTERAQLERTLRARTADLSESNRGKEEFLVQLAHDLRNCLVPIQNALHLWHTDKQTSPEIDETRAIAEREVRHVSRLLEDLLQLSRLAPSKLQPKIVPFDLAQHLASRLQASLAAPETRGHHIATALPHGPLPVAGDPDLLEQVLDQLLDNALKFTRPGGHIWVQLLRDDATALLRMRDDGIGISADMLPRVFDVFMRPPPNRDRTQGGVGIGLSLARRIVELHHGTIEAHSAGIGAGAEFVVRLPLAPPDTVTAAPIAAIDDTHAAPVIPGPLAPSEARRNALRVLIVDDNQPVAKAESLLLRQWGYEVRVAYDALAALEEARAHPPFAVLLDIGMPGMDGYEVARRLRAQPESQAAYLIALTGYGGDDDRNRAQRAGFDFHIVKPVPPDDLRGLLEALAARVAPGAAPAS